MQEVVPNVLVRDIYIMKTIGKSMWSLSYAKKTFYITKWILFIKPYIQNRRAREDYC